MRQTLQIEVYATLSTEWARALLGGSISSLKSSKPPLNFPEAGGFLGTLTPLAGSSQQESDGQSKGESSGREGTTPLS